MPRKAPSRRLVIDEEICKAVESRMEAMRRREDLSRFIEWVLDLYVSGYLTESEQYRDEVEINESDAHLQMWLRDHPEARDADGSLHIGRAEVDRVMATKVGRVAGKSTKPDDLVRATKVSRIRKSGANEQRKAG